MCKKLAIHLEEEKAEIEKGIRGRQLEGSRDNKEMNLTGVRKNTIDYRIKEYSEECVKALQNDENFNIIHTFIISVEECKRFMESPKVGRRFIPRYWRPITVKIAIK